MNVRSQKLKKLLDELLAMKPRLTVVQAQMKEFGLKPGTDLVSCMETTLQELEKNLHAEREVDNEIG